MFYGHTIVAGSSGERDSSQILRAHIILWDAVTGKTKHTLTVQRQINSLAFSPDVKILGSGSFDGTVLLWNITASDGTK